MILKGSLVGFSSLLVLMFHIRTKKGGGASWGCAGDVINGASTEPLYPIAELWACRAIPFR